MTVATFLIGIVLASAAGALIATVLVRLRSSIEKSAEKSAADAARAAAEDSNRPVGDTLARLEAQIRDLEAQRHHAFGGLEHHLAALNKETVLLSQALRAPNSRGRWGELTLRRVAELSGMVPNCDFYEQESGGGMRPDMMVRLPGGRTLAVDAKAPLVGLPGRRSCCRRRSTPRGAGPARPTVGSPRHAFEWPRILGPASTGS